MGLGGYSPTSKFAGIFFPIIRKLLLIFELKAHTSCYNNHVLNAHFCVKKLTEWWYTIEKIFSGLIEINEFPLTSEVLHCWKNFKFSPHPYIIVTLQGAKKIIFTACHSGKLKLAFTSPDVISTSPISFLTSRIDFTVLLPVGQVKTELTSPIAKSTSPRLSLTIFFAHCFAACWAQAIQNMLHCPYYSQQQTNLTTQQFKLLPFCLSW